MSAKDRKPVRHSGTKGRAADADTVSIALPQNTVTKSGEEIVFHRSSDRSPKAKASSSELSFVKPGGGHLTVRTSVASAPSTNFKEELQEALQRTKELEIEVRDLLSKNAVLKKYCKKATKMARLALTLLNRASVREKR